MTKKDFKAFLEVNRATIQKTTPVIISISSSDEWANETEWEQVFKEIKEEKCISSKLAKCGL